MLGSVPAEKGTTHTYTGKRASCLHVPLPAVLPPEGLRGCKHSQNTSGQVPSARAATGTAEFPGISLWITIGTKTPVSGNCTDTAVACTVLTEGLGSCFKEVGMLLLKYPHTQKCPSTKEVGSQVSEALGVTAGTQGILSSCCFSRNTREREKQEDPDSPYI